MCSICKLMAFFHLSGRLKCGTNALKNPYLSKVPLVAVEQHAPKPYYRFGLRQFKDSKI
jgi:hypothetical protein